MRKKIIITLSSLALIMLIIGVFLHVEAGNKSNALIINEKKSENGITITLEQLLLEDKKTTIKYHIESSEDKVADIKLSVDGKSLPQIAALGDGDKNSYNYGVLFEQTPYKKGDTLDIQFDLYNRADTTFSQKDSFTFSVPVNKIYGTREIQLDQEVKMKRGNPKLIHKVLVTQETIHIFHEVMDSHMSYEVPKGKTYLKLSTIGLNNTESISNIPIEPKAPSGILHVSGDRVAEKQDFHIKLKY